MAAHNLPIELFMQVFGEWARDVTFTYAAGGTQTGRGYFSTHDVEIIGDDEAVYSDRATILDIINNEFPTLPDTGDKVTVPVDGGSGAPALGDFIIIDSDPYDANATVTTYKLRKDDAARP
jgi:hypothetical protein